MSMLNNVIVTGTIQAVSKFASRGPEWVEGAKRVALRVNLIAGGSIAVGYLLLAAPLIAWWGKTPDLLPSLRLSAGVILCYALYAVFVGAANGAREFHKQAGLDITFTTLRAGLVLGFAVLFGTVLGAVGGFVLAAAIIFAVAVGVVGIRPADKRPTTQELLAFIAPVAGYLAILNALMFVDFWLLERGVAVAAEHAGATPVAATVLANKAAGTYNAALQLARLPYQAILAVTFVLFPLVSQSAFASDSARTRSYIEKSIRLSLIVVTACAVAVAARPDSLLAIIFPKNDQGVNEYLKGAAALAPLMFAYVAFSLLSIAGTIINGAGDTLPTILIGIMTLATDAALNWLGITVALAENRDPMQAAAIASTVSFSLGLLASLLFLQKRFGASLSPRAVARVAIAAAAGIVCGRIIPIAGKAGIVACVAGGLVYVVVLFATGELSIRELKALLRRG